MWTPLETNSFTYPAEAVFTPAGWKTPFDIGFMTLHGSRLYGMETETSDFDYVGACIESPEYIIGNKGFDQHTWKGDNSEGTTYSLKKFIGLFRSQNPTILNCMFSPNAYDPLGITTEDFRNAVRSRKASETFHGYMRQQMQRMDRGTGLHVVRAELIRKYGYDTKYASQMVRLGIQGVEYLSTGHITLPMSEDDRELCRSIRNGEWSKDNFMKLAQEVLHQVDDVGAKTDLPDKTDEDALNFYLEQWYMNYWEYKK